jgi:hypothetical protein
MVPTVIAHQPLEVVNLGREGVHLIVDQFVGCLSRNEEVSCIKHTPRGDTEPTYPGENVVAEKANVISRIGYRRALAGHVFVDVQGKLMGCDGKVLVFHSVQFHAGHFSSGAGCVNTKTTPRFFTKTAPLSTSSARPSQFPASDAQVPTLGTQKPPQRAQKPSLSTGHAFDFQGIFLRCLYASLFCFKKTQQTRIEMLEFPAGFTCTGMLKLLIL